MTLQYTIPENLFYDPHDFWVRVKGGEAVIGLSDYGQSNTGDILYLELPHEGEVIHKGEKLGSIESGKWVGNLMAPLSGTILETNKDVVIHPRKVNADAYGEGWMCRIKLSNSDELKLLMNARGYREWIMEQENNEERLG